MEINIHRISLENSNEKLLNVKSLVDQIYNLIQMNLNEGLTREEVFNVIFNLFMREACLISNFNLTEFMMRLIESKSLDQISESLKKEMSK